MELEAEEVSKIVAGARGARALKEGLLPADTISIAPRGYMNGWANSYSKSACHQPCFESLVAALKACKDTAGEG